jgi:acyl-[acyl-carrier-protein]-phospholipid O-acyltransferase/long-chain-fatty-acid--[acyl-carrier-protein] ligase
VLQPGEKYVGILLPSSVYGVVTNIALSMTGRVAANLNYTASADVLNISLRKAGIRRVLTSRKFTEQLRAKQMLDANQLDAELVYLEDVAAKRHRGDELAAALGAYAVPAMLLDRLLRLHRLRGDDELALIFTSGSTGIPKAVMLTHHNIATNVQAIDQVVHPRVNDVILGIVPFFHSLGFMVTLWGPMFLDVRAAYHTNPLEVQMVGKLARRYRATILLAPPTFLKHFLKRSETDDLATLDAVVTGAEKLSSSLCDAFQKKFGVRPVEGYGTTELSPLVSVNVPYSRSQSLEVDCKEGSVGRPVPGVSVKVVDPETFRDLPINTPGMLVVKGPNVMKGYLGQAEETERVIRDGWYTTGDIAQIDADGFIFITGRLSRIAKIGGEMIPLVRIEDALQKIVAHTDNGELHAAVTSIPDERRGERIVVLHTHLDVRPDEICRRLAATGMPNLWVPSPDSFVEVDAIPILGSGKTDLKAVDDLAKQHFNGH